MNALNVINSNPDWNLQAAADELHCLNFVAGTYLCLLAQVLQISRRNLTILIKICPDMRPAKAELLQNWCLRFTDSVLLYYEAEWQKRATFSRLNLLYKAKERFAAAETIFHYIIRILNNNSSYLTADLHFVMDFEPTFPPLLKEISAAPACIFYAGNITSLHSTVPGLAIVGSRKMTPYGERVIKELITYLSFYKINIVSGLAYGCDITAHRYTLAANLTPIAVLPNGCGECYPVKHRDILQEIILRGAAISEFLPWEKAKPQYFAARNRLISGLCQVTLIVEAAKSSGSLITANFASDQGREVLAVPGAVNQAFSCGCNNLIAEGCPPYLSPESLLEHLQASCRYTAYKLEMKIQNKNVAEPQEKSTPAEADEKWLADKLAAEIQQKLQLNNGMVQEDLYRVCSQAEKINLEDFLITLEKMKLTGKIKMTGLRYYLT